MSKFRIPLIFSYCTPLHHSIVVVIILMIGHGLNHLKSIFHCNYVISCSLKHNCILTCMIEIKDKLSLFPVNQCFNSLTFIPQSAMSTLIPKSLLEMGQTGGPEHSL